MTHLPLYLSSSNRGRTVTLATCRNCGKTKLLSRPCSLDHMAAFMEWNARHEAPTT